MPQNAGDKASPRGSWPKGPERAGDGIPAASGRQMVSLPQMGKVPRRGGWDDGRLFAHASLSVSAIISTFSPIFAPLSKEDFQPANFTVAPAMKHFDRFVPPPLRGAPFSKGATLLPIVSSFPSTFHQSASYVP